MSVECYYVLLLWFCFFYFSAIYEYFFQHWYSLYRAPVRRVHEYTKMNSHRFREGLTENVCVQCPVFWCLWTSRTSN